MAHQGKWTQAVESERLTEQAVVFKREGKQIALFRAGGSVYAVDNRCPHEGYPLAQGTVDEQCQLTCNWHNWKFRLKDGECVLGGDDVRAYPARDEGGFVWVDLSEPPLDVTQARVVKGLLTAFERREFDRICREVTRLKLSGIDPLIAVRKAIAWSHDRLEYGFTHAYAAAADWLAEYRRYSGDWERQVVCISETIDHMSFDALRRPEYRYAAAAGEFDSGQLLKAIEGERPVQAEGLIQRAFDDGSDWRDLEPAFTAAALEHYNDFGHSLIYVYKTRQLGEQLPGVERELSLALVRRLCYTTREDLIPQFSGYAPALEELRTRLRDAKASDIAIADVPDEVPFGATVESALQWVIDNTPGRDMTTVYDRLLEALARNMLYFDASYGSASDRPVSQNIGWLDFTHGITFANAVRACCVGRAELWAQGLLQMACFVGRNHSVLDDGITVDEWSVGDERAFLAGARERMLDHGFRDPIFSAHLVKTAVAVEEELPIASPNCRRLLLASLNRFLNSPLKQKHVRRLARQAIALVERDYGPSNEVGE